MNNLMYSESFRTRKFGNIFPTFEEFSTYKEECGLPIAIGETTTQTLYILLLGRYGNAHIASINEDQFKLKLMSLIFMHAPIWEKRLDIQAKLRNLTEEEIKQGTKAIYNHAFNPANEIDTDPDTIITSINDQNTTSYARSKIGAYTYLYNILDDDITENFLNRFKNLFLTVVQPQAPLFFGTIEEEYEEEEF